MGQNNHFPKSVNSIKVIIAKHVALILVLAGKTAVLVILASVFVPLLYSEEKVKVVLCGDVKLQEALLSEGFPKRQ